MVDEITDEKMDAVIENIDEVINKEVIIKSLNTFLFTTKTDSTRVEIITDADENTFREIVKSYFIIVGKNRNNDENIPGLSELLIKEGYYCSYNISQADKND